MSGAVDLIKHAATERGTEYEMNKIPLVLALFVIIAGIYRGRVIAPRLSYCSAKIAPREC